CCIVGTTWGIDSW
nr:immunoglobulin heavy chain junction region [Macaca mulatta]